MIENFSLEGVHRSNAVFNFERTTRPAPVDGPEGALDERRVHPHDAARRAAADGARRAGGGRALAGRVRGRRSATWFGRTVDLIRQRFYTLKDFSGQGRAYFADDFEFDDAAVKKNLKKEPRLRELLPALAERMEEVEPWTVEAIEAALRAFADEAGVKAGLFINASRTALTGQAVGPSMFDVFEAVGRERSAERLRAAARLV